jgi:hypothetical protein
MKLNALPKAMAWIVISGMPVPLLTLQKQDRWATPKERHSLFRFGAFVAARDRRPSINVGNRPPNI